MPSAPTNSASPWPSCLRRLASALETVGYCTPLSVLPGAPVALRASGTGGTVDIEVVRDGLRPDVVWRAAGVRVLDAPVTEDSPELGCGWDVTTIIPTDRLWRSGLYIVRLSGADQPSAWFVVRSPLPSADRTLLVLSTNTWNAYNDFGGRNLYTGAVALSFHIGRLGRAVPDHERWRLHTYDCDVH